jgi:hypothetical protein
MAKIERISPDELQPAPAAAPVAPAILEMDLARGKGKARFKVPTAIELISAEQKAGRLFAPNSDPAKFLRQLARICCIGWSEASEMPVADRVRVVDDEESAKLLIPFLMQIGEVNAADFCELVNGGSSRNDGFDAYDITLEDGTVIRFNEPSQSDSQKREKAGTWADGVVQFATALFISWDGKELPWSDVMGKFRALSWADLNRVAIGLSSFRG